jgi:hypothetical protein
VRIARRQCAVLESNPGRAVQRAFRGRSMTTASAPRSRPDEPQRGRARCGLWSDVYDAAYRTRAWN